MDVVTWYFMFGRVVQKQSHFVFQTLLFRKRLNSRLTALMLQVTPCFWTKQPKNGFFVSANTYGFYILNKEYCTAHHDDKMCFPSIFRYHIWLIGDIKEFLQHMDAFCFNYQYLDRLYTLFKYRFCGKIVVKSGQIFDNLQKAVLLNHQKRGVERMPSIAKKIIAFATVQTRLLSFFAKTLSFDFAMASHCFLCMGLIYSETCSY